MRKKKLYSVAFVIAVLLLGIFLFRPSADKLLIEDVAIADESGAYIKAQIVMPRTGKDAELPLISFSHGYGGDMDSAGGNYLAETLAKSGFATIRMDFAHYADKNLTEQIPSYTVDTMVEDQVRCIDYMAKHYGIDEKRVGLYGRSLGGRCAMKAANTSAGGYRYKAMALVAPAGDGFAMQRYMGGLEKWEAMKKEAKEKGSIAHKDMILTPEFFASVEDYVPSDRENAENYCGALFVIWNTEDYVVTPKTSRACAESYKHCRPCRTLEVTTKKSPHGYEMGFEKSELKDRLIGEITTFFAENL